MANRVLHIIPCASMSNGHKGLAMLAKKAKINPDNLQPGQFVLFINKAGNACKLLAANSVLVHYKHPKGHSLNYKALQLVPFFFDGQNLHYPEALKTIIKRDYPHLWKQT